MIEDTNIRQVPEPDCCRNCLHLSWGKEEGFARCNKTGKGISWEIKSKQICDLHVKFENGDPRNFSTKLAKYGFKIVESKRNTIKYLHEEDRKLLETDAVKLINILIDRGSVISMSGIIDRFYQALKRNIYENLDVSKISIYAIQDSLIMLLEYGFVRIEKLF
jgi:hypothetical protein